MEPYRTYLRLGLGNVARVAAYKLGLRLGIHPVLKISGLVPKSPFFVAPRTFRNNLTPSTRWTATLDYFSAHHFPRTEMPDWHASPFKAGVHAEAEQLWHKIGDFDPKLGDIKAVWELSRFGWLPAMAQRAAAGDAAELAALNSWIENWCVKNPPYVGVNWKCGQEASLRVLHLASAALILGQVKDAAPGLRDLIKLHCKRIAPTMSYAIGQANNHGTSEATALFIGGSWLSACGVPEGKGWEATGRRWLENRAKTLIDPDGTFSQYSVVYHRLMLDTYCFAEIWLHALGLNPFSKELKARLGQATDWLRQMVDPPTGDAPNLGANDGAHILQLTDAPYRDFRPSVQLGSALFVDARAYSGVQYCDQHLGWLGVETPDVAAPNLKSQSCDGGGFHVLRNRNATAVLRYPRFRFRPSQSDMLHVDLSANGQNILRDAGSFCYNPDDGSDAYFNSCKAHNTVQFDDRDQMPRLSRFLLGAWPKARGVEAVLEDGGSVSAAAGYSDYKGAQHHRSISLSDSGLHCVDSLDGNAVRAVLRWRLMPGDWQIAGNVAKCGNTSIQITANGAPAQLRLTKGMESRHYMERTNIPLLEVDCAVPATLNTEISF